MGVVAFAISYIHDPLPASVVSVCRERTSLLARATAGLLRENPPRGLMKSMIDFDEKVGKVENSFIDFVTLRILNFQRRSTSPSSTYFHISSSVY